jgi:hypothetical protein
MKNVLGALDRGETVIVLHRGKEKATLTPISSFPGAIKKGAKTVDQPLFGLWRDRRDIANPDSFVRKLRQKRSFSFESTTQRRSARKQRE